MTWNLILEDEDTGRAVRIRLPGVNVQFADGDDAEEGEEGSGRVCASRRCDSEVKGAGKFCSFRCQRVEAKARGLDAP